MKKILSIFLSLVLVISSLSISTTMFAADTQVITVTYHQTDARTMLGMINSLRTGSNAWYWSEDNSKKINVNVSELKYDYDLEKIAMLRAVEIAKSYSHTRPNGEMYHSAYPQGSFTSCGENIAMGTNMKAEDAFKAWREDNEKYSGQSHRRNMLSNKFTAFAVACVYYNGYYYWVQEFRNPVGNTTSTQANDKETKVTISLTPSHKHSYDNGKITKAASCKATGVKTYTCTSCRATKTEVIPKTGHKYLKTIAKASTSKNGSIVTKCTVCGVKSSSSVIYYPKTITLAATSYTYNGQVKTPAVTVKDSKGRTLKRNTDYTVTYAKGRKNVGKYNVTIKFKGNYSGTVTKAFTIKPKTTSISKLTAGKKKFIVKWNKQAAQTTGYQIQYSTDKNFKKNNKAVTVNKNKTTSRTISKLSAKKKYYVRIRTYKTVKINGKNTNIYSSWSNAKAVTTKK